MSKTMEAIETNKVQKEKMKMYKHPTPEEFREILNRIGTSQARAAEILKMDPRSIRRYVSGDTVAPYSALYTLIHQVTGMSINTTEDWREIFDPKI